MKIKSLLLGSVAAAGLSTGAFAADPAVLTSLDVCDSLGVAGLTISSADNCLQITGEVKYEFVWGDFNGGPIVVDTEDGGFDIIDNNGVAPFVNDWRSRVDAFIHFVAIAPSDFGPARAVIRIKETQHRVVNNEGDANLDGDILDIGEPASSTGSSTTGAIFDQAYVSIGDATMISAGKKGSIANFGNDEPLNFLGLFNSSEVDTGVKWFDTDFLGDGGHVIQVEHTVDNLKFKAGLENLNDSVPQEAGTAIGVVEYDDGTFKAHVTVAAGGILDGEVEDWGVHAGFDATLDMVRLVAAVAADDDGYWNALASASATFDIFTIAGSVEAATDSLGGIPTGNGTDFGAGASFAAKVTDDVTVQVGGRWYHDVTSDEAGWQVAGRIGAKVSEGVTLSAEVGAFGDDDGIDEETDTFYGAAWLDWAPGGGFTSTLKGEFFENGAHRTTFTAKKEFK